MVDSEGAESHRSTWPVRRRRNRALVVTIFTVVGYGSALVARIAGANHHGTLAEVARDVAVVSRLAITLVTGRRPRPRP